jgi:hypothetical protein
MMDIVTRLSSLLSAALLLGATSALAQESPAEYPGGRGPGRGKHIVLIAGDQEYRSEESIPALAQILASRHGFHCTVIFPINRQTGKIDPNTIDNLPGLEALRRADLVVLFARWLELPDSQMKEIIDYTESGRPIVALRTSTHPFNYQKHPESVYAKYSYNSKDPSGGFGRQVLGETWIAHYGAHQKQSTRGVVVAGMERHPILRGVRDLWGESDVYEIRSLSGDSAPIVMGQVLAGMDPASQPDPSKKLMPLAWTKSYLGASGKKSRIFTTTMGHVMDFNNEGFRRMVVNACYWAMRLEKQVDGSRSVDFVAPFKPSPIGVRRTAQ